MAVVLKELYLPTLIAALRASHSWMGKLKDESSFVGNNVIHLTEIGADPKVLINNSVYPIATHTREDNDLPVSLNKYDTENTRCTVDELYGLPYDKPGSIIAQHKAVLEEQMGAHGLYTLAPPAGTTALPVLVTTGPDDGTGRKMLVPGDLIRLQKAFDDAKIPKAGRMLILSNEHVADLLVNTLTSYAVATFQNIGAGNIVPMLYGFELYQDLYAPVYNLSTKTRKAYGAASQSTDSNASIALSAPDAFRAYGSNQMFYRAAELDPENRSSVVGFQVYGIAAPYTRRSQAALLSGKV